MPVLGRGLFTKKPGTRVKYEDPLRASIPCFHQLLSLRPLRPSHLARVSQETLGCPARCGRGRTPWASTASCLGSSNATSRSVCRKKQSHLDASLNNSCALGLAAGRAGCSPPVSTRLGKPSIACSSQNFCASAPVEHSTSMNITCPDVCEAAVSNALRNSLHLLRAVLLRLGHASAPMLCTETRCRVHLLHQRS